MSLTDKQKAEREKALGSSDAPVVCGVSPYKSPLTLYYQLHGELPRYDDEETEAMEWGSRLEAVIAEAFSAKTGCKIRRKGLAVHPRYEFLRAHLDFEIVGDPKGPGVLEIKTRDRVDLARWEREGVPDDTSLQVAHQLAATNREWAKIAVLFGGRHFRIFELTRDKEIEEYLIELEAQFMVRVEKGEPPDVAWDTQTISILKKLYPTDSGKTIVLDDPEAGLMYQRYQLAKTILAQAENDKAAAEGWLKDQMKDASIAEIPGTGVVTWKTTKPVHGFDEARFKQDHLDLYAQYMGYRPGYRRFLVKQEKGLLRL